MPRRMPQLAADLRSRVADALALVRAGELARASAGVRTPVWRELHVGRLELLYEIAYLRIFVAWETFLEETFFRYLCGFESAAAAGQARLQPTVGSYARTLADAETMVLRRRAYELWHDPYRVMRRSAGFFVGAPHEVVIGSNVARVEAMAHVRHRIAHAHADARAKFNNATMMFCGKRFAGERAGRFLRDTDPSATPPCRWLESLGGELSKLAAQVA